ncbi:MAG: tRNA (adenosine(37)-N6)-threonylcarbamoyltransferase complex ATPase subunit type 1 TsaE [Nitrospirae bacterium]|nr:tRNA (adenosine(37)-N6)-threonylcarbamoyltransferase complex ATPase subunit type 1 TsaE [Nitrospirota bacterium]
MITITSHSIDQTLSIGRAIGRFLKKGDVVCLYGDLGSGKTMLCKGIASHFDISERDVTSPSYTIINEYWGLHSIYGQTPQDIKVKHNLATPFYHIDLYRLSDIQSIEETGLFEVLNNQSIAVIEWAERLEGHVECSIKINLDYIDADTRRISIAGINEEDWNNC